MNVIKLMKMMKLIDIEEDLAFMEYSPTLVNVINNQVKQEDDII